MRSLLGAIKESPALPTIMAITTAPNLVSQEVLICHMVEEGFPRSVAQMRAWWKAERAAFKQECACRELHGGSSEQPLATYHQMQLLWQLAGCPRYGTRHHTSEPLRPRTELVECMVCTGKPWLYMPCAVGRGEREAAGWELDRPLFHM